uniref:Uncharacterized protein n=1 Tax=Plectus sambesii TaxID=2011161 RepID=A0A914VWB7_9BILA
MTYWRAVGLNYVRYSQLAAEITRKCLKSSAAKEAEKRGGDPGAMDGVTMRTKQTDSGIDVSMSSPSDLALSFAGDRTSTDLGLLDLDSVLPDDDESWLYGPSAATSSSNSDTSDLIGWLQNAAATLEPKQRRALSQKLENIAKKKQVGDALPGSSLDPTDSLIAEIDGLLGDTIPKAQMQTRRDSVGSDEGEFYDAASDLDSTDPSLLIRTSTPQFGSSEEAMKLAAQTRTPSTQPALPAKLKVVTLQSPTVELSTPDFVTAEEKMLGRPAPPVALSPNISAIRPKSPAVDSLVPNAVKTHPELHPDLQDIQLLASMQEEDLRKALEKLQQQRLRKLSQNSAENANGGGVPATNGGRRAPAPIGNANMDRFDALAREVSLQQQQTRDAPQSAFGASPAAARVTQQQPRRSLEARVGGAAVRTKSPRPVNSFPSNLNGTSLQKSLPNLASSRSTEFSNRQNAEMYCEQGSCNDINDRVSPAPNALVKKSGLRQPTPRRVSVGLGVRSGIPSPSPARTSIPMPTSGIKRVSAVGNGRPSTGQPAPPVASRPVGGGGAQSQQRQLDDSWKEDCF